MSGTGARGNRLIMAFGASGPWARIGDGAPARTMLYDWEVDGVQ